MFNVKITGREKKDNLVLKGLSNADKTALFNAYHFNKELTSEELKQIDFSKVESISFEEV